MANDNVDINVSQVLPGTQVSRVFEAIAVNFGISSQAFQSLLDDLKILDPNHTININEDLSLKEMRRLFQTISLYKPGFGSGLSGGWVSNSQATLPFVFSFQNLGEQFAGPAAFYTNENKISSQRWVLPVPPSDFQVSIPNSPTSVTTISGFTYTHAGPIDLDEITFEGFFPYVDNDFTNLKSTDSQPLPDFIPSYISTFGTYAYHGPREWVENLVTAMRANQPLIFSVYATDNSGRLVATSDGVILEPTAMSVSSFQWDMGTGVGGSRRDVRYSITLKRWRRQQMPITQYVDPTNSTTGGGGPGSGHPHCKSPHKVKKGETLHKLAQHCLGSASDFKLIQNKNPKKIARDFTAYVKANPHNHKNIANYPITPGLVLRIPKRK